VRNGQFKIDVVFDGTTPDNIRTGQSYHIKLETWRIGQSGITATSGFFQSTGGQWCLC